MPRLFLLVRLGVCPWTIVSRTREGYRQWHSGVQMGGKKRRDGKAGPLRPSRSYAREGLSGEGKATALKIHLVHLKLKERLVHLDVPLKTRVSRFGNACSALDVDHPLFRSSYALSGGTRTLVWHGKCYWKRTRFRWVRRVSPFLLTTHWATSAMGATARARILGRVQTQSPCCGWYVRHKFLVRRSLKLLFTPKNVTRSHGGERKKRPCTADQGLKICFTSSRPRPPSRTRSSAGPGSAPAAPAGTAYPRYRVGAPSWTPYCCVSVLGSFCHNERRGCAEMECLVELASTANKMEKGWACWVNAPVPS